MNILASSPTYCQRSMEIIYDYLGNAFPFSKNKKNKNEKQNNKYNKSLIKHLYDGLSDPIRYVYISLYVKMKINDDQVFDIL